MQTSFTTGEAFSTDSETLRREVDALKAWSRGLRAWTLEVCTASMEAGPIPTISACAHISPADPLRPKALSDLRHRCPSGELAAFRTHAVCHFMGHVRIDEICRNRGFGLHPAPLEADAIAHAAADDDEPSSSFTGEETY